MSWEQLLDIARESREDRKPVKPIDCPEDGEVLEEFKGKLHCKFCGRIY